MLCPGQLEAEVRQPVGAVAGEGEGVGEQGVDAHPGDVAPVHPGQDVREEGERGARVDGGGEVVEPPVAALPRHEVEPDVPVVAASAGAQPGHVVCGDALVEAPEIEPPRRVEPEVGGEDGGLELRAEEVEEGLGGGRDAAGEALGEAHDAAEPRLALEAAGHRQGGLDGRVADLEAAQANRVKVNYTVGRSAVH